MKKDSSMPMATPDLAIFLATSGHSGVDRVMRNLIDEFSRRGLRIDLLQITGHGPYLEEVPENVRLVPLGVAHVNSSFPTLVRYLRQQQPQVLLTDKDRVNRLAILARKIARVPTRIAVRSGTTISQNLTQRGWLDRSIQKFSFRRFYPWADHILVPSEGAARDLAEVIGLPYERISVVPSPVLTERFTAMAAEPVEHPWLAPGEPPVILSVGELCARKDFPTLLRAVAEVRKKRPVRLVILGEGRQRGTLEELVRSLDLGDSVTFPGFVQNPYAWMARAAVFVLTSLCEGAPVVLMEALAAGTPVISTDCPSGPREILANGRYGPLVAIGDSRGLATEILNVLAAPLPAEFLREGAAPFSVRASGDSYLHAIGLAPQRSCKSSTNS